MSDGQRQTRVLALIVGLLAGVLAPTARVSLARSAQAGEQSGFTLEGKIIRRDVGKLTVSSGENIIFHVVYDQKTGIKRKDGTAGSADDLKVGAMIRVEGELAESGEIISRRIELE